LGILVSPPSWFSQTCQHNPLVVADDELSESCNIDGGELSFPKGQNRPMMYQKGISQAEQLMYHGRALARDGDVSPRH
jgi:hypothetical protein